MNKAAKIIQFLGIVITGVGLIYGIVQNDMGKEFAWMAAGILVFLVGYLLERR